MDELEPDDNDELIGRVLDNRYVLEKLIGRGGYGDVYRAIDNKFGKPHAVKVGLSSREFMREAKLLAEVSHPHIVSVSDYGYDGGLAYLVMEYLQGEDLEELFKRQNCRLSVEQLLKFIGEIGDALACAHAENLIHRDLKLSNVFVKETFSKSGTTTGHNKFVLLDFGIASKLNSVGTIRNQTQDGAGTIAYMAPELLKANGQATIQSDIYAFGVVLYQLMVGRVPFPETDNSLLARALCMQAITTASPPRFREIAPDREFPSEIEELVIQCLDKQPSIRPLQIADIRQKCMELLDPALNIAVQQASEPEMVRMPEDPRDLLHRTLGGRYVIDEYLASGGYGDVYRGTDTRLKQPVAIKLGLSSREFMKEAQLAASVEHDNIVRVTDFGYDHGLAYLVMDYLHGEHLEKLFNRLSRKLTPEYLRKFVDEVGNALAYAHGQQLIHRDLKPRNIILREHISKTGATLRNSKFVLLDFGIAAKLDSEGTQRNRTQDGAGTLEYMAPELLDRDPQATPQSDIYAFGTILYQLMMGSVPFPQEEGSHVAQANCVTKIKNAAPPRFCEVDPHRKFPNELEELVLQCLEKKPEQRPKSMSEVRQQFLSIFDAALSPLPTPRKKTIDPSQTIRPGEIEPDDVGTTGTIQGGNTSLPQNNISPTSKGSAWRFLFFSTAAIVIVLFIANRQWGSKSRVETELTYALNEKKGIKVDEPLKIVAGTNLELTFAIQGIPASAKVDFEPPFAFPDGTGITIKQAPGPTSDSQNYVISTEINTSPTDTLPPLVLRATSPSLREPIERSLSIGIERPLPWLPQKGEFKFVEATDSRLCKIGEKVYASVLQCDIGEHHVRFRLVPEASDSILELIDKKKVSTFYIMEELVSKALFSEFVNQNPDFEIDSTIRTSRPWTDVLSADSPVTEVYALEAQKFARWLGGPSHGTLPSKTEWELAAGYWDFRRLFNEIDSDQLDSRTPVQLKTTMPITGAEVWIASKPALGEFRRTKETKNSEGQSPYGIRFGLLPRLDEDASSPVKYASEWTSTLTYISDSGFKDEDLRRLCKKGPIKIDDPAFNSYPYEVYTRGATEKGQEIDWLERKSKVKVRSIDGFNWIILPLGREGRGFRKYIGFRVVLLTEENQN